MPGRIIKYQIFAAYVSDNRHILLSFDFDDENLNVIPVVYLEGRINHYNDDDTPEFNELNQLCQNLFQDEVLPEIRPDLFEQNNEA